MICFSMVLLSAVFKAAMDVSADGKMFFFMENAKPISYYWYKDTGWRFKYKNGDPKLGEKFLGSTTVLVSLTDFWHLAQMIFLTSIFAAIIFYKPMINWWADFIIMRVAFGLMFELMYG